MHEKNSMKHGYDNDAGKEAEEYVSRLLGVKRCITIQLGIPLDQGVLKTYKQEKGKRKAMYLIMDAAMKAAQEQGMEACPTLDETAVDCHVTIGKCALGGMPHYRPGGFGWVGSWTGS